MTETKFYPLSGGLDLVTPAIATNPGRVVSGRNYEPSPRGYRRIDGWERFDGRVKPSSAEFTVLTFSDGTFAPSIGNQITGTASGKTAFVIENPTIYSGSFETGDATGAFPVTGNTGLLNGEPISVGSVPVGIISEPLDSSGPTTLEQEREWSLAAREFYRSKILAVPGSGPVRGVWTYNGSVYAFRNNAGGTACIMYKATVDGWQSVVLGSSISFDAGTSEIKVGDQIAGSISGAIATVMRVALQGGDWSTDDGKGRLIVSNITGVFQNNETIISTSAGSAVVDGNISQITLPPGGRYSFDNHNFTSTTGSNRMYGVNGVGYAFEFDGVTLTPVITGEQDDKPIRIAAHKDHLFLGYSNGRVQHSSIYNPLNYEIIQGSLLAGIGEEITDMVPTATGELLILGRNKVGILYGTNSQNWNLVVLTNDSGAVPWTTQLIGTPLYLDDVGVRSLESTQSYGNFSLGTKTQPVQPLIANKARGGIDAVASIRVRKKDIYRLYWKDGSGISIYFGRKHPEIMMFELGFTPSSTCSGEDVDGNEILFVGSENGFVYEMDIGTSADGEPILAYIRLPFNHVGSPTQKKRWHKAIVEVDASPQTKISVVYTCAYGNTELPQPSEQDFLLHGGGGFWNEALWNTFNWSSPVEGTAEVDLKGIGQNLSVVIISEEAYSLPHALHGITLHYNYRRLAR